MSTPKIVKIVDPRIEPRSDPSYAVTVSPSQAQNYFLPASGKSNSYVTFANIVPLGPDRAYLDSFELLCRVRLTFNFYNAGASAIWVPDMNNILIDAFPFNSCVEEYNITVNGGAFFSNPLSYLRAKLRYVDDKKLMEAYGNVCPCNKAYTCNESGSNNTVESIDLLRKTPSRCGDFHLGYASFATGTTGCSNNDVFPFIAQSTFIGTDDEPIKSLGPGERATGSVVLEWREPIFCSPFSNRLDETYGQPLYNITSMDIAITLMDLTNMFRIGLANVESYSVDLDDIQLCYQVMTIPPGFTPPSRTIIPYRRFVPYTTEYPTNPVPINFDDAHADQVISMTSGVYQLNEVPTAIWVFLGPTKGNLQRNPEDGWHDQSHVGAVVPHMWSYNKLFAQLRHISISCANTTQILNTYTPYDLYRIAKANGCQDSYTSWARKRFSPSLAREGGWSPQALDERMMCGAGSVLRLIPGTDIVLPDRELIPGANARNITLQISADFNVPSCIPPNYRDMALWLLFEYVGEATLTPGQCSVRMNPLGNMATTDSVPAVSSGTVQTATPSTMEGSGWLDKLKSAFGKINKFARSTGIIGEALKYVPGAGPGLSAAAKSLGYGYKRGRDYSGGAVMGMGDFI